MTNQIMNKSPEELKRIIKSSYISLAYSILHSIISIYALYELNINIMYLGFIISTIYYVYATYDVITHYKMTLEKNLSLVHHILTLYILSYYEQQPYFINLIFAVTMTSNIFLYVAYIQSYTVIGFPLHKMIVLFLEAIIYIFNRTILASILLPYYYFKPDMDITLYGIVFFVYLVGIWWSYGMYKSVKKQYSIYKVENSKKKE